MHLEVDNPYMLHDIPIMSFPQLMHLSLWGSSYKPGTNISLLLVNILSHSAVEVVIFYIEYHKKFADLLDHHNLNSPHIMLATPRRYLWDDLGHSCMLFWELAEEKAKLCEPNHSMSLLSIKIYKDTLVLLYRQSSLLYKVSPYKWSQGLHRH